MALPEPHFIDRDPAAITEAAITEYEVATGRTLQPAQIERLLLNQVAYRETLARIAAQEVGKQNLVEFATYPMLDHLGQLVGVTRLPVQPARSTVTFTTAQAAIASIVVPLGTRVATADGKVVFATSAEAQIAIGQTTVDVEVVATAAGFTGNGYSAGTLTRIIDPVPLVATAANITQTTGGANIEPDDQLRERIKLAPNEFSVAGPRKAYIALARKAHQDVVSVAVLSPTPGDIDVYPLTKSGLPSTEIKNLVIASIDGEDRRPHGDSVQVLDPVEVIYAIDVEIQVTAGTDQPSAIARVTAALQSVADRYASDLGGHVVIAELIAAAKAEAGVYDVQVIAPAATMALDPEEWASCSGITVTVTGVV